MGHRGRKIKSLASLENGSSDVFFMNLEEAKRAIIDKYEHLHERYERRPRQKPLM